MSVKFTDNDVTSFLRMLVSLGNSAVVDDTPDKFIRYVSTGDPVKLTVNGVLKPAAIYGTASSEAVLINPFAEGEATTVPNRWFEHSCTITLGGLLIKLMKTLLNTGVEQNKRKTTKGKKSEEEDVDLRIIKLLGKDIVNIDEAMVKEFDSISNMVKNFLTIYYDVSEHCGRVNCIIFSEAQRKSFSKVRNKSWDVFRNLMCRILDIKDLDVFKYEPSMVGIPAFESFVNILVNIYQRIKDHLEIIDVKITCLGELTSHLKYLPEYYSIAKWAIPQTVTPAAPAKLAKARPVVQNVPYSMPTAAPMMTNMGMTPVTPNSIFGTPHTQPQPQSVSTNPLLHPATTNSGGYPDISNPFAHP